MARIKIGLIGGSGLAEALSGRASERRHEVSTPFGAPSDAIHEIEWAGATVLALSRHGPGHLLNPSRVPYRANIFALKQLGCTHIIASGAVGSLRDEFAPRDLVVADQIIDATHQRANTFYDHAAVHVEFAQPFCGALRQLLLEAGKQVTADGAIAAQEGGGSAAQSQAAAQPGAGDTATPAPGSPVPQTSTPPQASTQPQASASSHASAASASASAPAAFKVHDRACYVCMEGPAFSTRAQSLMHRLWGGDLIGMTAMPEAKLAREAEISYALLALVTDYDCWKTPPKPPGGEAKAPEAPGADAQALLREILGNLEAASANALRLIERAIQLSAAREEQLLTSPAQSALQLAIWSDKSRIEPGEVQRLGPLWMKHF